MKKIVLKQKEETTIDDINDYSLVGVKDSGGKNMIIRGLHGEYTCLMHNINLYGQWKAKTVKGVLNKCISEGKDAEAYLFNTKEELIKWWAES